MADVLSGESENIAKCEQVQIREPPKLILRFVEPLNKQKEQE